MKHFTNLKTWLLAAVLMLGVGSVMGATITIVPDQATTGSTAEKYVETLTNFNAEGVSWAINNWNPDKLQVRGNQSNTSGDNFQFYNTTAIPGSITKVTMTYTEGKIVAGTNVTLVTGSSVQSGTSTGVASLEGTNSVYWDLTGSDDFFRIQFTKGGTSGTAIMGYIEVEYTTGGGTPSTAAPTFSPTGGTYFEAQSVSLSSTTENAKIYYTLDNSDPSKTSTLYASPISIATTTTVKAIAYDASNENPSSVTTAFYTIASTNGDGSKENPFTLEDVTTLNSSTGSTKYWVKGYIVGANEKDAGGKVDLVTSDFPNTAAATMIYIADDVDENDIDAMHPVQLPSGSNARAALNLVDNPSNYLAEVLVYGTLETYFGKPGVKNVTDYELGTPSGPVPTITVTETSFSLSAEVGETADDIFEVEAVNLTADIELAITGTHAAMFSYELDDEFDRTGGIVLVTYEPTAAGSHTATLTISSTGASSKQLALSGTATGGSTPPLTMPDVIITEVYGGGGNSGATYTHDFIELFNTTNDNVSIEGWSVQYYSAAGTGTSTNKFTIPAGKFIPAKKHFLIQAAGGTNGVALTDVDATCTINLGAKSGKVILYTADDAQSISDINSIVTNSYFVDYLPFGKDKSPTPLWGSMMTVDGASDKSIVRKKDGLNNYIYTQNIGNDFEVTSTPSPEGSLSTGINNIQSSAKLYVANGNIYVHTTAGTQIEIYNVAGQKVINQAATVDGFNRVDVTHTGVLIVKAGEAVAKVVM